MTRFVMLQGIVSAFCVRVPVSYLMSKVTPVSLFKIGLATKPADTAKDFSAAKHVVGSRVNFQPETHWTAADGGRRRRVFLEGLTVEETPVNDVDKDSSEG